MRWDERFDCNHFAGLIAGTAQAMYTVAAFQSATAAQTLALVEIWYCLVGLPPSGGHASVGAVTEIGVVFIDPQNGKRIVLTLAEKKSVYFSKW